MLHTAHTISFWLFAVAHKNLQRICKVGSLQDQCILAWNKAREAQSAAARAEVPQLGLEEVALLPQLQ